MGETTSEPQGEARHCERPMSISPGDILRAPGHGGGFRVWKVTGVHLGGLKQESVVEIETLDWTGHDHDPSNRSAVSIVPVRIIELAFAPLPPDPPAPAGEPETIRTGWEIATEWYNEYQIVRSVANAKVGAFGERKIPVDVASEEFGKWLTHQYRLAMNKGIQFGRDELSSLRTAHADEIACLKESAELYLRQRNELAGEIAAKDAELDQYKRSLGLMTRASIDLASQLDTTRERIELARQSLIACGYFTPEQVGDDIAPRIGEVLAAKDAEIARLTNELGIWKPMTPAEAEAAYEAAEAVPIDDAEIERIVNLVTDPTYRPSEPEHVLLVAKVRQLETELEQVNTDFGTAAGRLRNELSTCKADLEAAHAELAKVRAEKDEAIATRENSRVQFDTVRIERDKLRGELEEAQNLSASRWDELAKVRQALAKVAAERDAAIDKVARRDDDLAAFLNWLRLPDRKPASLAFTAGPWREAADWLETAAALRSAPAASSNQLPTPEQHPDGLNARYRITKHDGTPCDPRAFYFVLRLDPHGDDKEHIAACQHAALTYANFAPKHLRQMADELRERTAGFCRSTTADIEPDTCHACGELATGTDGGLPTCSAHWARGAGRRYVEGLRHASDPAWVDGLPTESGRYEVELSVSCDCSDPQFRIATILRHRAPAAPQPAEPVPEKPASPDRLHDRGGIALSNEPNSGGAT